MLANDLDTSAFSDLLRDFAKATGADGVTLWSAGDDALTAMANPLEPDIVGLRQPLSSGLISRVLLTGQPILETDLAEHPAHDPTLDRKLGQACRCMMAAPWQRGENSGVISAVLHHGSEGSFSLSTLHALGVVARKISNLSDQGSC